MASVLVLALVRGALAVGLDDGDGYYSPYNYAGSATFTVTNYTGEAVANFPTYLKISEALIPGFRYADVKNGTDDLVFFDSLGKVLTHEIETWNPSGESHVWLKLPYLREGEKITMCWNLRDGCTQPERKDPSTIWSGYVGVWHMDSPADSSPNNAPGVFGSASVSRADGVFGTARGSTVTGENGALLVADRSAALDQLNHTGFTASFYIRLDTLATKWAYLFSRKSNDDYAGWGLQFAGASFTSGNADGVRFHYSSSGQYFTKALSGLEAKKWQRMDVVMTPERQEIWVDGVLRCENSGKSTFGISELGFSIGGLAGDGHGTLNGDIDEFRLSAGNTVTEARLAAEIAVATNNNLWAYGTATNDVDVVLKNKWTTEPSITKTTWDADDPTDRPTLADFDLGTPGHGTAVITFYNKTTGESLGSIVPKAPGEYRAIVTVDESRSEGVAWGALERTIDFRIVSNKGLYDLGDNATRVLLLNDDYSAEEGAVVEWQSYDDEDGTGGYPFWRHLDSNGYDASSTDYDEWSVSPDFNLGGGTHHQYCFIEKGVTNLLWDLNAVRFGNTFNNGDYTMSPERDAEGLQPEQNYLPWDPESQRVPTGYGYPVGSYHRYVSHAVMQNVQGAAIASSMYTNGIGTIYFDAVNGWTNNVYDADGNANYRLVVEIATNCKEPFSTKPPTDANISSNPGDLNAYDPFLFADWKPVEVRVLRFNGTACTDLGMADSVVLDVEQGGSYTNFYRIIAPVSVRGNVRFRIRRTAIDPDQSYSPDGSAYVLIDNVICSTPPDCVNLEPYGRYDATKTGHAVQGWGGAFTPAFPVAGDTVYGRAKATMANGGAVPAGAVSSATMHYRWHCIDQKTTGELLADLDPATFVSRQPLDIPPYAGDIEFWFDLNQTGNYYEYFDYSGTGRNLGDSGYCEVILSVTNRAPSYATEGDWFVRQREGKSSYAEMVLLVKTSEDASPQEVDLWVNGKNLWRGYYKMTESLADGIWWRIEPRDLQTDGATAWNSSTNWWYVADWTEKLPTFPATGRMSEGTTNSWCRMTCDKQTDYLMFQVDESSRGVTVLHAAYQNFNDWNSPNEYFSGSSAETNKMHGTSSEVKTYDENYKSWTDESSTNKNWQLDFSGMHIGTYAGYKTFPSFEKLGGWNLGKGMWVYGKYREDNSYIAYQAAGCGEGYADFIQAGAAGSQRPRGIGSVSLKARLAQAIAPDKASYFDDGSKLTNYTFMVRGCFDRKQNTGFAGNAALSLFAYYRSGKGTYEARWEQIKGKETTNKAYPTAFLGPQADGQRLVISRWDAVGDTYQETELYAVTNAVQDGWKFSMPLTPYGDDTATNNLMPFCISVYQESNATVVAAAVRVSANIGGGVSWDRDMNEMRDCWYFAVAVDKSSQRLKRGTYGVLTSNSEGMMLTPQFRSAITHPSDVTPQQMVNISGGKGVYSNVSIDGVTGFLPCYDDLADDCWSVNGGRQEAFYDISAETSYCGFTYVAEPQTVDIYTSPTDGSTWTLRGQVPVTGFGKPYNESNLKADLYFTDDCKVRIKTGGELDDYRRDVVMSDISLTQWRGRDNWSTAGSDWNFDDDEPAPSSDNYFGYTNIVFTSGWVTNGAVRLSAKRAVAGSACSVRSPLFDGLYQDRKYGYRSVGLGVIRFRYREPTKNIRLKVQVVTNYTATSSTTLKDMSRSVKEDPGYWTTLETLDYDTLKDSAHWDDAKKEGEYTLRLGWHGVRGMMRVVIDDDLTQEVADETDPTKFGEIDILEVTCKDEPAIDKGCWWGWNIKTVGDANDSTRRMYLADYAPNLKYLGQSMALNNSVTDGTNPNEDSDEFLKHLPFVQSPSFTNALIGQISFKARKYDISDRAPDAKVVVYGAKDDVPDNLEHDDDWTKLEEFDITNTVYETFTCKTQNEKYYALRLAVLIDGTDDPPPEAEGVKNPQRVLLDEVVVSEAVSAMLSFRNVGAFRGEALRTTGFVEGVPTKEQQPLCDENWGIQAEVFAAMLEDEICTESNAVVTLYWFEGTSPWGYENWKNKATGQAKLAPVDGDASQFVYRSSYELAPDAVMPAQSKAPTVVQYMLRVEYWTVHSDKGKKTILPATNWLDSVAWQTPDWYAPLDYNANPKYGAGKTFAGYTILDKVAPGWAWINEVNILGEKVSGDNTEEQFQYVEVCAPEESDISGWQIRFLEAAIDDDTVVTNRVARFGSGTLSGTKTLNAASNMVFHCVGNKESDQLKKSNGSLDAVWSFSQLTDTFYLNDGVYCVGRVEIPFGVQLVRPSGIIEHSIVVVGTNRWSRMGRSQYDPTNIVAKLNKNVPGSKFFYAAEDNCGTFRSGSVVDSQGESAEHWANDWWCSPGFINTNGAGKVQQIEQHPMPAGDTIIIRARVDRTGGPICQRVGGAGSTATNDYELIILSKGGTGTNIVYAVMPWYEVASVTTNATPAWMPGALPVRELNFTVGAGASNNIEVIASAMQDRALSRDYGLTEDNSYTPAVLDWLHGGETLKRAFANDGTIVLADYVALSGAIITNMDLTSMYWLDMDPTISNQAFIAGMIRVEPYHVIVPGYDADSDTLTNVQMTVKMMITNRIDGFYSPYVLRGLEPKSVSTGYNPNTSSVWTSETFKVTGILANGLTSEKSKAHWVPLRWFVFDEDSFYQPEDEPDHERYTADIEIVDPLSISSPGAEAGWYDWVQEHGKCPVFNSWSIDTRLRMSAPEMLKKNSYYE